MKNGEMGELMIFPFRFFYDGVFILRGCDLARIEW
jgi:hypothetical protein